MKNLNHGHKFATEDMPTALTHEQVLAEKTDKHVARFLRAALHWGALLFILLHGEPDLLDTAIKILSKFGGK